MDWFYGRRPTRKVTGGIKAQNKRGPFGATWWGRRWVTVLEGFNLGERLARGGRYARGGQVMNIDIEAGQVSAKVQGSYPKPYKVRIELPTLSAAQWKKVIAALNESALHAAKLLAGEMPQEVEAIFQAQGAPLFPTRRDDLETECSCPDYSNPCKHIAAVYLLLAEEFDRDPFLLFRLRGRTREQVLAGLSPVTAPTEELIDEPAEPLPDDPAVFWQGATPQPFGEVAPPREAGAWVKRLGNFPFWRGEQPLVETLVSLYGAGARQGLAAYLGDAEPEPAPVPAKKPRKRK